ncbi:putative CALMODULIN-BINDING PROTEIN60 [Helianthus anomalus]
MQIHGLRKMEPNGLMVTRQKSNRWSNLPCKGNDECFKEILGVCYVLNKISFTHSAEHTRNSLYRLVAVVVDVDLMNGVEVAMTESFVMQDRRYIYKVCYLKQIGYKGPRYTRPKDTDVCTLKDLLRLLYTNPKRHEEVLSVLPVCGYLLALH